MKPTIKTIVISIFSITASLVAFSAVAITNPPFLTPLIALGMPTRSLISIPILGNALLSAQAPQIGASELKQTLDQQGEEILLIDVRTKLEFDRDHLPGAIHINVSDIEDGLGLKIIQELQSKQSRKIITYCHSGTRSNRAIDRLRQAGISATNLTGGVVQWRDVVDPNFKLLKP